MTTIAKRMKLKAWIEAVRLRTLPVSTAGVLTAWALALHFGKPDWLPAVICLVFAVLCQIVSNFANEYYDYRDGMDKPGRQGPRRGVTEGDISPSSMRLATFSLLLVAMILGLWLIYWSGPWLIIVGVAIAAGAMAYSSGPYPLSRKGLGEVAVLVFFGIVPVNFTYYLSTGAWDWRVAMYSVAIGLMGANVLIVNNYRDAEEDAVVGKNTLATLWGREAVRFLYLVNGIVASVLAIIGGWGYNKMWIAAVVYFPLHIILWCFVKLGKDQAASVLNPLLGMTAMLMLLFAILSFIG